MRKLALDLDALRVESFATEAADAHRGTVRAHDDTMETENTCLATTCVKTPLCTQLCTPLCTQNAVCHLTGNCAADDAE